jgi:phage terminase small subunit
VKLNPKQARFVQEYLIDLNATQAAIRAGYSIKTSDVQGPRLLGNVGVAAAIADGQKKLSDKTGITQQRILDELAIVAFSDIQNYVLIDNDTGAIRAKGFEEMPEGASRALQAIDEHRAIKEDADGNKVTVYDKVNFRMHDKLKALDLLGKHLGMFKERVEHSGSIGGTLTIEVVRTK